MYHLFLFAGLRENRKMKLRGRIFLLMICLLYTLNASGEDNVIGGRAVAMGGCSAAASDLWSLVNNPAGLGFCEHSSAGIYGENAFLLSELNTIAAGMVFPIGHGGIGACLQQFGFSRYRELQIGTSYGMKLFRRFSAGVVLDYRRTDIGEGYGSQQDITFGAGLQYAVRDRLVIGFHLSDPVMIRFKKEQEILPVTLSLGLAWKLTSGLTAFLEAEKETGQTPLLRAGMEYRAAPPLFLRIGIHSNPWSYSFGIGLAWGRLMFDLASSYNLILGYSPQCSLQYRLGK